MTALGVQQSCPSLPTGKTRPRVAWLRNVPKPCFFSLDRRWKARSEREFNRFYCSEVAAFPPLGHEPRLPWAAAQP